MKTMKCDFMGAGWAVAGALALLSFDGLSAAEFGPRKSPAAGAAIGYSGGTDSAPGAGSRSARGGAGPAMTLGGPQSKAGLFPSLARPGGHEPPDVCRIPSGFAPGPEVVVTPGVVAGADGPRPYDPSVAADGDSRDRRSSARSSGSRGRSSSRSSDKPPMRWTGAGGSGGAGGSTDKDDKPGADKPDARDKPGADKPGKSDKPDGGWEKPEKDKPEKETPDDAAASRRNRFAERGVADPNAGTSRENTGSSGRGPFVQPGFNRGGVVIDAGRADSPGGLKRMVTQPGVDGDARATRGRGSSTNPINRFAQPGRRSGGVNGGGSGAGIGLAGEGAGDGFGLKKPGGVGDPAVR